MSGVGLARWIGTCEASGKRMYTEKADAKRVARMNGKGMTQYLCEECDHYHVGHRGRYTRAQHRARHAKHGYSYYVNNMKEA